MSQGQQDTGHICFCSPPVGACGRGRPLEQRPGFCPVHPERRMVWFTTPPDFFLLLLPSRLCPPHTSFPRCLHSSCSLTLLFAGTRQAGQAAKCWGPATHLGLLRALESKLQETIETGGFRLSLATETRSHEILPQVTGLGRVTAEVRVVERGPPFVATALQNLGQFEIQQPKCTVYMETLRGEHRGSSPQVTGLAGSGG